MESWPASESCPGRQRTLDAVNEQLEKAIEQMRVSNAALVATRQELHSLTSLLDTMQQEVEMLSHDGARIRTSYFFFVPRYAATSEASRRSMVSSMTPIASTARSRCMMRSRKIAAPGIPLRYRATCLRICGTARGSPSSSTIVR